MQVIAFWPNGDGGTLEISKEFRNFINKNTTKKFRWIRNIDPSEFISLLYFSNFIIGNSSAGIRECGFMGVPCINLGERQLNRITGPNVTTVNFDNTKISNLVSTYEKFTRFDSSKLYGNGDATKKVMDVLKGILNG